MAKKREWFYAKTYGFGWTLPATWEGWVVVGIYLVLLLGGIRVLSEAASATMFAYVATITAALVAICWLTGERPAWRWGRRKDAS